MKTSDRGLFSKQKKPFFSSGKARFCSRREMLSIAQKYLPNPTASCLPLSEELSSGFQSSTPSVICIYIMYAREGEGLEVSLQRLFLQGLFLRRRAPVRLLNMSSERRRELLRQHQKQFCERQKSCFWHSKKTKEERGKTYCCGFYFPFSRICSNPCAASKNVWRVVRANCRWKWRFTGTLR